MNKKEAKDLLMKFLMPELSAYGFRERKIGAEWALTRKTEYGEDGIVGGFSDYNPVQRVIYSLYKKDKRILNILLNVQKPGVVLPLPITKYIGTIGFSYESLHGINQHGYLPDMVSEDDVKKNAEAMVIFLKETGIPLLDKFNNLHEIDQIINGDQPWRTDWQKPYTFSTYFDYIRLIVAKLAGNPKLESLINFTFKSIKEIGLENGYDREIDPKDLTKPFSLLVYTLQNVDRLA
jgi:DNA helicase HerA-like ATPase